MEKALLIFKCFALYNTDNVLYYFQIKVNSRIAQWVEPDPVENGGQQRNIGDKCSFVLGGSGDSVAKFVLHQQIRSTFTKVWTYDDPVLEV